MDNKIVDECLEHPGEQRKLVCIEPCKIYICQNCVGNHRKHDIRTLTEVAEEMMGKLRATKAEKISEQTVSCSHIETLDLIRADIEKYLKEQVEEEKRMEQIITEPLREIITGFQEKVNVFLSALLRKKELCEQVESTTMKSIKAVTDEISSLETWLENEKMGKIYEKWLLSVHGKPSPKAEDDCAKEEPELDIETLKSYATDLKGLKVTEKMKIIVDTVVSALQTEKSDPITQLTQKIISHSEELKVLQETVKHSQESIKATMLKLEEVKKEMEKASNSAIKLLKKDKKKSIEKIEPVIDKNEAVLKSAREKLISAAKTTNSVYAEVIAKQKELNKEQIAGARTIIEWTKEIQRCEKENSEFKKQMSRVAELMEDYGKIVKKFNLQYALKLKEFDKVDDKLQYMRDQISQQKAIQPVPSKTYKLRISIISASNSQSLPLPLINLFLFGSETDSTEPFTGTKGYSISVKFGLKTAEFDIWYLGCLEDAKSADHSYYQNVESVLLVYTLEENETETVESVRKCTEFLKDKTQAMVVLTGINNKGFTEGETGSSNLGAVADYAVAEGIPLKLTNVKEHEEVKELFYGILYAKYPDLYEEWVNKE